jgi:putative membrane protein insertion efficiency factor
VADPGAHPVAAWLSYLPRRCLRAGVMAYRFTLKPWLGQSCRFEPTCSQYALDALDRHGAAGGAYLAARRILRCSPLCVGGCDPVPAELTLFSRLSSPKEVRSSDKPS